MRAAEPAGRNASPCGPFARKIGPDSRFGTPRYRPAGAKRGVAVATLEMGGHRSTFPHAPPTPCRQRGRLADPGLRPPGVRPTDLGPAGPCPPGSRPRMTYLYRTPFPDSRPTDSGAPISGQRPSRRAATTSAHGARITSNRARINIPLVPSIRVKVVKRDVTRQ